MWHFKDKNIVDKYNKTKLAEYIGIRSETLRRIINGKQNCSKLLAYCITKTLNKDAEIENYFERVK